MDHYLTGQVVRRLRERKKLTQQQLGEAALVTANRCTLAKLYPEGTAQLRFPLGGGTLYWYCNRHGLYSQKL